MKKIMLLFCLLVTCQCVFAYGEPQWSEYCPPRYINVSYVEPSFWNFFKYNVYDNNYWAARKNEFNNQVNCCRVIPNAKTQGDCYASMREAENNKNAQYYQAQQLNIQMQQERDRYYLERQKIDAMNRPVNVNIREQH